MNAVSEGHPEARAAVRHDPRFNAPPWNVQFRDGVIVFSADGYVAWRGVVRFSSGVHFRTKAHAKARRHKVLNSGLLRLCVRVPDSYSTLAAQFKTSASQ